MTELNVIGLIVCVLATVGLLWLIVDGRKRKARAKRDGKSDNGGKKVPAGI